jgi:hypothetical protein
VALVVESGVGLSNAESYIAVVDADTRHSNLGNIAWAALVTADKESALRRATQFMLQSYRTRWTGFRNTRLQALDWPRYYVMVDGWPVPANSVPADVANVCADLALRAATGDLSPDLERGIIMERVGSLETQYDRYSPQAKRFAAIESALAPYLKGSPAMASLVRT